MSVLRALTLIVWGQRLVLLLERPQLESVTPGGTPRCEGTLPALRVFLHTDSSGC